jgi:two-component system, sensor histidine kinase and response regulator
MGATSIATFIPMTGFYDYRLVALSVLIAVCAAYTALDLAGRTTAARGRLRLAWLAGGAVAMGVGIWSMHYVGMLAFNLPVPVLYDWPTVLLSLLAAIFAAAVALFVVSRKKMGWPRALVGSAIMGSGIAAMHYTGMAAMRLPATCSYEPLLFTLSVVFAIAISLIALLLSFRLREENKGSAGWKAVCAVIMGSAIPVMHYTGMAAARFMPSSEMPDISHSVTTSSLGFAGVSAVTMLVLGVTIITAAMDRRLSEQRVELDASERRYQLLVDGVRDYAIILLTPVGEVASWNVGAERITGYRAQEIIGRHFSCFYEEDMRAEKPGKLLETALKDGKVESEGWRVRKDGSRFWADVVIAPLTNNQRQLQGFSSIVRDITERRRADENLRELYAQLLQVQEQERKRLARELHDSAGQLLAALSMNLVPLQREVVRISPQAAKQIVASLDLVDQLSSDLRTISHLLHPPLLDELGLNSALKHYVQGFAERSKVKVDLRISPDLGRFPNETETAIFRIIQECLTNIHRHSGSATATIGVSRTAHNLRVEVADEGKGMSSERRSDVASGAKAGVGLRGMRERLSQLGGTLDIGPGPDGKGTAIIVQLPARNSVSPEIQPQSRSAVA